MNFSPEDLVVAAGLAVISYVLLWSRKRLFIEGHILMAFTSYWVAVAVAGAAFYSIVDAIG